MIPSRYASKEAIGRASYRWNTVSGMLMAFQSVIMLVVLTHVSSVTEAGVFTIAYANANLFLTVGNYGMRQFQVSDRSGQFTFGEYRMSRLVTCLLMIVSAAVVIAYFSTMVGYDSEKAITMNVMVTYKAVDCAQDVYNGRYQQLGRLDVGAFAMSVRLAASIACFSLLVAFMGKLLVPLCVTTAFTALFFVAETKIIERRFNLPGEIGRCTWNGVGKLLRSCTPLFAAAFLLYYIGNAPKYAIDAIMGDVAQAHYGYIAMPVFVVSLLASFIYNPMIVALSELWRTGKAAAFVRRLAKVGGVIVIITVACIAASWLIGVPVLDVLYNTSLVTYRTELAILVAGGGFLALATLATLGLTIIRFQRVLAPVYLIVSLASYAASNWAVDTFGVTGASWVYFGSMVALAFLLMTMFVCRVRMKR